MVQPPKFSIIIPVYNRPKEVDELLDSLSHQSFKGFEVILVEDGSSITSKHVFEKFAGKLSIHYFFKPNSGPGPSRNFGFSKARGDYFIVFDSDCIIPPGYLDEVEGNLQDHPLDAWGGPDRGHEQFTALQQAMGFTMSSFLTTGGIRGGKKKLTWFQPRSFNMGISRRVFDATSGFKLDRYAEDIELSIRIRKAGFKVGFIPGAFVYHKRRTTLPEFFRQVSNFGKGRVIVGRLHPEELKLTHWFPSLFTMGIAFGLAMLMVRPQWGLILLACYVFYAIAIWIEAAKSLSSTPAIALSAPCAFVQLIGYGIGFMKERLKG